MLSVYPTTNMFVEMVDCSFSNVGTCATFCLVIKFRKKLPFECYLASKLIWLKPLLVFLFLALNYILT